MAKTKKKVKLEAQDIKLEDLEQAVDEVNEQLDLDPGIEKGTDTHMRKELKEAMTDKDLFEGDEEFTSKAYNVLEALGIEHDCVKVKDVDANVDEDEDGNGGEGEEEEVITDVPPKKKQERTAKKENKKGETAMKTKKINAKKKGIKRVVSKKIIAKKKSRGKIEKIKPKTRVDVFSDIMKNGGGSKDNLISNIVKECDSSKRETTIHVDRFLKLLANLEFIKQTTKGKYILIK